MTARDPLLLSEVGYSVRFTNLVKRILRLAWIAPSNACVAWIMFDKVRSSGFPSLDWQLCFEFAFEVVLPIAGIVLEAVNWKFARWVNVGSLTIAASFWLVAALWDRSDPFFGVLLLIGLGLLTIAAFTELVYKWTRSATSETL